LLKPALARDAQPSDRHLLAGIVPKPLWVDKEPADREDHGAQVKPT
jgi:hypothetical protein